MKTSISSDVWEKKKALIAKLYMEEEWPLKQVIKQIRSDDFNPSETQLRSRLKKWRVTKPSRQTRKKPQASGSGDDDSEKEGKGKSTTPPMRHRPSPGSSARETTGPEWTMASAVYPPTEIPHTLDRRARKWNPPLAQQLTPSPSGENGLADRAHPFSDPSPTISAFDHSAQPSPVDEGLMVNTAVTPTYPNPGYPLSPDSCLPSPGAATTPGAISAWPNRSVSVDLGLNLGMHTAPWYSMPFEAITPPPGAPHSTASLAPSIAGYRDHMSMMVPPGPSHVFPSFGQYPGEPPAEYAGYGDAKSWKRAMSLRYDFAGPPERVEQERKPFPSPGPPFTSVAPTQSGPHAGTCAPIMSYMGQDPMAQKPPGVGY
ncbi:hypothetical protein NUU61_005636 [Penicillium alfredii]|uniref:Clr5 domain-containing protein n=1 Tax=Penicillium alfredii TaxID=1506179 RepID=A0A9W9FA20_9EURO|nr:uncharacterized protein NUU61_005636 [Penicillium alfredii]KAJ5096280.1 hypothetical protein NUU61_005636 [Penicillium alfredii]